MNTIPPFAFCLMMYHGDMWINTSPPLLMAYDRFKLLGTFTVSPQTLGSVGEWGDGAPQC